MTTTTNQKVVGGVIGAGAVALGALSLLSSGPATWYVRPDGGTPAQCNGATNAAYSASASPNCAVSNLMYLLPPNIDGQDTKNAALIRGGDVVRIAAGQYPVGEPFGTGIWDSCKTSNPWDCMMQPVPSGTTANLTQIIGAGSTQTQLFGQGGTSAVINLTGSNYVVVQGLEITDHSNCIKNQPDKSLQCQPGGAWASNGITNTDGKASNIPSTNVTLTDLNVHGMAKYCVQIGNTSNLTVTNAKFIGCGLGGWTTDLDPAKSESNGVNTFTNVEFGWNGCTENYPSTTIWGCWGQMTGGYGDGFGSASSSEKTETRWVTDGDKGTWIFQNVQVYSNTQDGLDFLHADPSAVITFDHVNAYRNAGNQLKGNGNVSITNSVINANCSAFQGNSDMHGNNGGGGGTSGDICRALGDAVVVGMVSGQTTTVSHNTIISEGNCLITVPDSGIGDSTSKLIVSNNILIGQPVWVDGNQNPPPNSCLYYWNLANVPTFTGNVIWGTKGGTAPAGNTYADPKLANETLAAFDPTPTALTPPGVGAIQGNTPPPVTCTGGIVSGGACYCGAGTTLISGACGAVPKQCTPTPIQTVTGAVATCSAVCQ